MTLEELSSEEKQLHKQLAIELFNYTWKLIDKNSRTQEENDQMIHAAHASRFHWGLVGQPLEFERGEWQISRVYSILNMPSNALYHAQRCLDICQQNNIADFDLAFAYESLARANAITQNVKEMKKNLALAKKAAENISNVDDKNYFLAELKSIKV